MNPMSINRFGLFQRFGMAMSQSDVAAAEERLENGDTVRGVYADNWHNSDEYPVERIEHKDTGPVVTYYVRDQQQPDLYTVPADEFTLTN